MVRPIQARHRRSIPLATLTARLRQCEDVRRTLPNVLAVDFFGIGDTVKVVDNFNAAVASVTGTAGAGGPGDRVATR